MNSSPPGSNQQFGYGPPPSHHHPPSSSSEGGGGVSVGVSVNSGYCAGCKRGGLSLLTCDDCASPDANGNKVKQR